MDNPAPTDVAIQLGAIALLVLVTVVVLSLGLALLCRRRYVAAVVRLQGRSQVQRNEVVVCSVDRPGATPRRS